MGSAVVAKCPCGVKTTIRIGCGFGGPKPAYFPCLCDKCRAVVRVDLADDPIRCPDCNSMEVVLCDESVMQEQYPEWIPGTWDTVRVFGKVFKVTSGNTRCPQCQQETLRFTKATLFWD